jgi:mono/diheme cytochrome c family protein/glucose/arabinose dehydrogenase
MRIDNLPGIFSVVILFITFNLGGCTSRQPEEEESKADSLAIRNAYATSPLLNATEAIAKMKIEPGFEIKLVASEPLVEAPVAMVFDNNGRMWVVEMVGYMPDTDGVGEEVPNGRIVILTDKDKDGVMDERKVFLDSLVLPRAICLVENGILYAEPPRLFFVENSNDKPGKKILVDSLYAESGNAEHQPNGLLRAMDNWIYNAEAKKRYRKTGDRWQVERTIVRGQWGLSQDDYGRLFYNNNSQNLLGDYFLPAFDAGNDNQRRFAGYTEKIVEDNRVYPSRPTPGVNRGYMKGILDDSLRLVNFTAASGPVIYRGDLFGKDYYQNAFVGEPAGNLIKRNLLEDRGYMVEGKQAYKGKEFLSSTDERFRPVTLYNGPDGALYILDMYRGVIQHKTYLTEYLKNEYISRKLSKPLNCGRIYKVVPENKSPIPVSFTSDPLQTVKLLQHPNGWVRDKAQQILVDGKNREVVPLLKEMLKNTAQPVSVLHALWTLEGLQALDTADLMPLLQNADWHLRVHSLTLLAAVTKQSGKKDLQKRLEEILSKNDSLTAPYLAFSTKVLSDRRAASRILLELVKKYPASQYVTDAVISTLQNREVEFFKLVQNALPDTTLLIHRRMKNVLTDIENRKHSKNSKLLEQEYPRGFALFSSICQGCHGADGNGIRSLAPPLNNSSWVTGDKYKLLSIVLYGLTGPIQVGGKLYEAPEITGDMPGIGGNKELTDEDIAQLLSFIRNSWNNRADKVIGNDVNQVRQKYKGRQKAFTMQELQK